MARTLLRLGVVLLAVWTSPALGQSDTASIVDMIASRAKAHREQLRTYRVTYTVKNFQKRNSYFDSPQADMERTSRGTYVMDRTGGRFKYETDCFHAWHRSRKEWRPVPYTVGNDGKKHILLTGRADPATGRRASATLSDATVMNQIGSNPRSFLSRVRNVPLDKYLLDKKDSVSDAEKIDEYRYKITLDLPVEKGDKTRRVEIIVDSRFDWSITSERRYSPTGRLYYDKSAEFVRIGGVCFPQRGRIAMYVADGDSVADSTVDLEVDPNAVEINPEVSDADFQIDLPPGTLVFDMRHNVTWTVPELPDVAAVLDDPAIAFASDESGEDSRMDSGGEGQSGDIAERLKGTNRGNVGTGGASGSSPMVYAYIIIPLVILALVLGGVFILRRSGKQGVRP